MGGNSRREVVLRMLGFAVVALLVVIGVTNASHLSSPFSPPTTANVAVVSIGQEAAPLRRRCTEDKIIINNHDNEKGVRANLGWTSSSRLEASSAISTGSKRKIIHMSQLLSYGGIIERGGGSVIDAPTTSLPLPFLLDTKSTSLIKVYSLTSLIITQSLNIACGAFVVSGYFGAYVASWMIHEIRNRIVPKLVISSSSSSSSPSLSSLSMIAQLRDYRWTTLALLGILLPYLSSSSSYNLDMHRVYDDIVFATLISLYSYIVDPLLGGLIGCTHVMVGLTASIIGNSQLGNMIGRLGDVRYRKLHNENDANDDDDDDDGSSLAYVDPTKRPFRLPMVTSRSTEKNSITTKIVDILGSTSLLIVSSQHFLGLYMLGTTLVSLWSKYCYHSSEQQLLYKEVGQRSIGITGRSMFKDVVQWWLGGIGCPWKLPKRLVVLYWVILLSKLGAAYILM